jgi:hypothetical protein
MWAMNDSPMIHELLAAFIGRTEKTGRLSSTRVEVAAQLDRSRLEVDPIFDEAIEKALIEEDSKYRDYWQLSAEGQLAFDQGLFS